MLQRVDRLFLRVQSLPAAVAYYRDVVGLKLVRQEGKVASFRLGDGTTELVLHDDADLPGEAVYYLVEDVRGLYEKRASLKLSFGGPPTRAARGYRAKVRDPFGNVLLLIDRTAESSAGAAVEDAKSSQGLFTGFEPFHKPKNDALVALYEKTGRTADDLPYTPHFESLYKSYAAGFGESPPTRQETWRHLLNIRKRGKLPKLGEARSKPPEVSNEAVAKLREMLGKDVGKRDRLPYTERFEKLVDEFNTTQPRPLSPHLVWRLVATLAK
ncbi:MAG TPA: VOC family protein [Tepidisphaeraceae bacterium]|nr:VOC family protein [Tepidisphaeraceae bacterium]